jgi:CubicO group peptidase (beta-lactamase class C family)
MRCLLRSLSVVCFGLLCQAPAAAQEPAKALAGAPTLTAEGQKHIDELLAGAVAKKQVAGAVALVGLDGKVVYHKGVGMQDIEAGKYMAPDTIFRIASMSKPVTSVAAMILVEEGKLRPDDPVSRYIPGFKQTQVLVPSKEKNGEFTTAPAEHPVTVHHLLTHTSGITYGFFAPPTLGEYYTKAGVSDGISQTEMTTAENAKRIASVPLLHQPGASWTYGLNTDVLGRVVEVASGQPLEVFCRARIFEPLKMKDTSFYLPPEKLARLAALYNPGKDGQGLVRVGEGLMKDGRLVYSANFQYKGPNTYFSGGAGLVSTAPDYFRFLQMLVNGGELDGARVLKPTTVKTLTTNQIGKFSIGAGPHGDKFGYGFGVVTDAGKDQDGASVGSFSWGGLFYTYFWADPQKKLVGVLMTQIYPNAQLPLRTDFKKRVYEALP